jgi:putative tricarboxylic transport membrane protein
MLRQALFVPFVPFMPILLSLRQVTAVVIVMLMALITPSAVALDHVKIMIGANPGGGFDQTARALGKAMLDAGVAKTVQYENKGGAGGTIALAQFVSASAGDDNALIVTGAAMVGAIEQNKPPVTLANATPIARLFHEFNVFVVPANSPIKTMKEVLDQLKRDPSSVKWAGGSRGSVDHVSVAQLAKAAGVDPTQINYVPFQGGGEASAAILQGYVTVGTSGWNELAEHISSGRMRALAVSSGTRLPGVAGQNVATLKELGINVEINNWRGVYAAPGLTAKQQKTILDAVTAATKQKSWIDAMARNDWFPALLTGTEFSAFVDAEHKRIESSMRAVGLVK